jgi:hypothetical protein
VPRINCYAPGCDRAFHSFCYDQGVLRKNGLGHFDGLNLEHPFLKIACKKDCHRKAFRHHANMTADPEDRNIPWNRDGREGDSDPNNSENILITWLQHPSNYQKFRSPPCGKTKMYVCEQVSKKIELANTLKARKANQVMMKIQAFEGAFREAHDWVNNTGVGVLERDGQVTFEEAVKKRFVYYYDLVDVMSERASSRPKASTDTMTMAPSSSSSSSEDDEDDDGDGIMVGPPPAAATTAATPTRRAERSSEDDEDDDEEADASEDERGGEDEEPTFASPSPASAINSSTASYVSSLTPEAVLGEEGGTKRRGRTGTKKNNKKTSTAKKAKKTSRAASKSGSRVNPHEIDCDDSSWQVSMLDFKRDEVELEKEKWDSQKQQHTLEIALQQEKWQSEKKQQNLEYKFDLMVKYKKLQEQGFDNHQIVKMIPDMRPIIDTKNMPINLQLSPNDGEDEEDIYS